MEEEEEDDDLESQFWNISLEIDLYAECEDGTLTDEGSEEEKSGKVVQNMPFISSGNKEVWKNTYVEKFFTSFEHENKKLNLTKDNSFQEEISQPVVLLKTEIPEPPTPQEKEHLLTIKNNLEHEISNAINLTEKSLNIDSLADTTVVSVVDERIILALKHRSAQKLQRFIKTAQLRSTLTTLTKKRGFREFFSREKIKGFLKKSKTVLKRRKEQLKKVKVEIRKRNSELKQLLNEDERAKLFRSLLRKEISLFSIEDNLSLRYRKLEADIRKEIQKYMFEEEQQSLKLRSHELLQIINERKLMQLQETQMMNYKIKLKFFIKKLNTLVKTARSFQRLNLSELSLTSFCLKVYPIQANVDLCLFVNMRFNLLRTAILWKTNLVSLDLRNNKIEDFPFLETSNSCPLLLYLKLSYNKIKHVSNLKLLLLRKFKIKANELTRYFSFKQECYLPSLETLDISCNALQHDFFSVKYFYKTHPKLKLINLSECFKDKTREKELRKIFMDCDCRVKTSEVENYVNHDEVNRPELHEKLDIATSLLLALPNIKLKLDLVFLQQLHKRIRSAVSNTEKIISGLTKFQALVRGSLIRTKFDGIMKGFKRPNLFNKVTPRTARAQQPIRSRSLFEALNIDKVEVTNKASIENYNSGNFNHDNISTLIKDKEDYKQVLVKREDRPRSSKNHTPRQAIQLSKKNPRSLSSEGRTRRERARYRVRGNRRYVISQRLNQVKKKYSLLPEIHK